MACIEQSHCVAAAGHTYNLHGLNQGKSYLPTICESHDLVLVQEHWLLPNDLDILNSIHCDFIQLSSSAMMDSVCRSVLRGRPHGGVGILVRNNLFKIFKNVKCLAKRERFIAISVFDIVIINLYLPVCKSDDRYKDELTFIFEHIANSCCNKVVLGGDFNFELCDNNTGFKILSNYISKLGLMPCDDMMLSYNDAVTYSHTRTLKGSFIDHFCVSSKMWTSVLICCYSR